jgi:periplasmic protein CpxP/Spy
MPKDLILTFNAAFTAGILALGASTFAQSEPATPVPGHEAPQSGPNMHHPGMMGGMNRMDSMTRMSRMMENCNRMMEGMRQPPSGAPKPEPDHG